MRTLASHAVAPNHAAADDIVAEAFEGTMHAIQAGAGPTEHFRAYLLTSVRNGASRLCADQARLTELDDADVPDSDASAPDHGDETEHAARAFQSLSARHQSVLWHMEVEGRKPRDLAPMLGIEPNAVSALLVRATKSLRMAYLADYFTTPPAPRCAKLSGAMRKVALGVATRSQRAQVSAHVATCERCEHALADLMNVTRTMRSAVFVVLVGGIGTSTIGGILLGAAAPASAAGLGAGAAVTAHGATRVGLLHSIGAKTAALIPRTPAAIGIAAASAVVVTAVAGAAIASATMWNEPTAHAEAPVQPGAASGSTASAAPTAATAPTASAAPTNAQPAPSAGPSQDAQRASAAPAVPGAPRPAAPKSPTAIPTIAPTTGPTSGPTTGPTTSPTPPVEPTTNPTPAPTTTPTPAPAVPTAPKVEWAGVTAGSAVVVTRTDGGAEPATVRVQIATSEYFARWIIRMNASACSAGPPAPGTVVCTFSHVTSDSVRVSLPGKNSVGRAMRVIATVETAAGRSDSTDVTLTPAR